MTSACCPGTWSIRRVGFDLRNWWFGYSDAFAFFGIAVFEFGPIYVSFTWPVEDGDAGLLDAVKRELGLLMDRFEQRLRIAGATAVSILGVAIGFVAGIAT